MCQDAEEVRLRADWPGHFDTGCTAANEHSAAVGHDTSCGAGYGAGRRALLVKLQGFMSTAVIVPPNRMATLLAQVRVNDSQMKLRSQRESRAESRAMLLICADMEHYILAYVKLSPVMFHNGITTAYIPHIANHRMMPNAVILHAMMSLTSATSHLSYKCLDLFTQTPPLDASPPTVGRGMGSMERMVV